jgi:hypothetical protein
MYLHAPGMNVVTQSTLPAQPRPAPARAMRKHATSAATAAGGLASACGRLAWRLLQAMGHALAVCSRTGAAARQDLALRPAAGRPEGATRGLRGPSAPAAAGRSQAGNVCQFVPGSLAAPTPAPRGMPCLAQVPQGGSPLARLAHRLTVRSLLPTARRHGMNPGEPPGRPAEGSSAGPVRALLAAAALLAVHPAGLADTGAPAALVGLTVDSLLWSLRAMVGSWVVLMAVVCVLVWRGPSIQGARWRFALWACVLTLPLPWIAMISGWLALELGQRPQVGTVLATAPAEGPAQASTASLLGWGCAYAALMIFNIKLSLRWLRLEPQAPEIAHEEPYLPGAQPSSPLVEGLARRYRVGEFQSQPPPRSTFDRDEPLLLANVVHGKTFDVDKLRRAIVRLRKERNALRKALKPSARRSETHSARIAARPALPAPRALPVPAEMAEEEEEGGETQMIPVLRDVVKVRRSSSRSS